MKEEREGEEKEEEEGEESKVALCRLFHKVTNTISRTLTLDFT